MDEPQARMMKCMSWRGLNWSKEIKKEGEREREKARDLAHKMGVTDAARGVLGIMYEVIKLYYSLTGIQMADE